MTTSRRALVTAPLAWALAGCGGADDAAVDATAAAHPGGDAAPALPAIARDVPPLGTTLVGPWRLETGANPDDDDITRGRAVLHPLHLSLDTRQVTGGSVHFIVGDTSGAGTPVLLFGVVAVSWIEDALGLNVTVTMPAGTRLALVLSGRYDRTVTLYSTSDVRLVLDGVHIASRDGPALNLQSRQRTFVACEGDNLLSDGSVYSARRLPDGRSMDLKAACFAEGPLILSGSGRLRIDAHTRHALVCDAHVRLRSGTLTLAPRLRDGLRAKHAFVMDGGALTITAPAGRGIKVEGAEDAVAPVGFVAINDGALTITSHDKALTASWESDEDGDTATLADDPDARVTINGGVLTITTTGLPVDDRNPADGDSSLAPEGIEAKSTLTVHGGTIIADCTDDALNAGTGIAIHGGRILARSRYNDGIDSNGPLTITGGVIVADGAAGGEGGIDCDALAFTVTGGIFIGLGGRNSLPTLAAARQNCVAVRQVPAGLMVVRDTTGRAAFAYTMPRATFTALMSSPLLVTGSRYSVVWGGALADTGARFEGLVIEPGAHSGGSVATSFVIAARVTQV